MKNKTAFERLTSHRDWLKFHLKIMERTPDDSELDDVRYQIETAVLKTDEEMFVLAVAFTKCSGFATAKLKSACEKQLRAYCIETVDYFFKRSVDVAFAMDAAARCISKTQKLARRVGSAHYSLNYKISDEREDAMQKLSAALGDLGAVLVHGERSGFPSKSEAIASVLASLHVNDQMHASEGVQP